MTVILVIVVLVVIAMMNITTIAIATRLLTVVILILFYSKGTAVAKLISIRSCRSRSSVTSLIWDPRTIPKGSKVPT